MQAALAAIAEKRRQEEEELEREAERAHARRKKFKEVSQEVQQLLPIAPGHASF